MPRPRIPAGQLAMAIELGRPGPAQDLGAGSAQRADMLEEEALTHAEELCHVTPPSTSRTNKAPASQSSAVNATPGPYLSFSVPGEPRGKGRPRFQLRKGKDGGNFIHKHTDDRTLSYEAKIGHLASLALSGRPPFERGTPLRCTVLATYSIAASWPKKRRAAALAKIIRPTKKPDGDNILKTVGDALNGVVWIDDVDVVEWIMIKVYGDIPSLCITICPVEVPA